LLLPYLLAAPAFALMLGVLVYPLVHALVNSFSSEATIFHPARFVGLANYQAALADPIFARAVGNTLYWTVAVTVGEVLVGLYFALLLQQRFVGRGLLRGFVMLPWLIPSVVGALGWAFMFNPDYGFINQALNQSGLGSLARPWLGDPTTALPAAILVGTWKGFGFYMLMLLAGLQGISPELYEAARMDGAGHLALFRHITLPGLRAVLFSSVLLGIIWTANYFDAIYILTGGGPARLTETLPIFVFVTAFTNFNINEAIAASNLLLLIVVALLVVYVVAFSRFSSAEDRLL
jgi:multiple sugar transport system permease protein